MSMHAVKARIEQEMAVLNDNIERHKGVGVYHSVCERWQLQAATYADMLQIVSGMMGAAPDVSQSA